MEQSSCNGVSTSPVSCIRCHRTQVLVHKVLEHLEELNQYIYNLQGQTMCLQEQVVETKRVIEQVLLENEQLRQERCVSMR